MCRKSLFTVPPRSCTLLLLVAGLWLFVSGKVFLSVNNAPRGTGHYRGDHVRRKPPGGRSSSPHFNASLSNRGVVGLRGGGGALGDARGAAERGIRGAPQRETFALGLSGGQKPSYVQVPAGHPGLPFGGFNGDGGKVVTSPFAPQGYPRSILPGAPVPSRRRRANHPEDLLNGDCQWHVALSLYPVRDAFLTGIRI